MQKTAEISLNPSIDLKSESISKYNYGYWLVVFFSVVMIVFVAMQFFGWLENDEKTLIGNSLKTVIGIVGIIMSYSVTKSLEGKLKHTWKILTLAYLFNTGGDTIWYYYASILGEKPFPSWADVSFLISYPVMLWALLAYPTQNTNLDRNKFLADISIVMVSGITLVWYFIIHPTISSITDEDWISPALNLSYTVGDMVLILGILVAFFRGVEENLKRALQIIVAGVVCMLIADLGFAYLTLQGTYFGGHWIENFFIFNSLSHIYAAYYQYRRSLKESENEDDKIAVKVNNPLNWFPYAAVFLGLGLLLWESSPYWEQPVGKIILSSIIITILVIFRQIIAVRENSRLLAEQAKQQSEAHLSALVQNSSDLITILDRQGEIIYESPSLKNVLGYEMDELIGRQSLELVHPEDVVERKKLFTELVAEPDLTIHKELRFKHKDGSWRVLETVSKLLIDESKNLNGILVNSRDITQRKKDEEKLRVYTSKLEQSNRELQDFAYVASHDLQEPLRKVQAFGDRLNKKFSENLGEEGSDYIRRMSDAANRMQRLINDLLTFSRVTTKAQPFQTIDLNRFINEVVSDLEVRIEETSANVEIGELAVIDADPTQIRQLFQNLIGNALKFSQKGKSPQIKVYGQEFSEKSASFFHNETEIQTSGSDEKSFQIFVEDNGIGFDEKYLDRIFTVFQRLHGRTEYEGSGIGLAVCRKIVERHHGEITAKSKEGEGSTFIITLPFKQNQEEIINERP